LFVVVIELETVNRLGVAPLNSYFAPGPQRIGSLPLNVRRSIFVYLLVCPLALDVDASSRIGPAYLNGNDRAGLLF